MNIDYEVRKSVARWCRGIGVELDTIPNHVERGKIAGRLITTISPVTQAQDVNLPNIVALVRAFTNEDPTSSEIDAAVDQVLALYVKLGALQG